MLPVYKFILRRCLYNNDSNHTLEPSACCKWCFFFFFCTISALSFLHFVFTPVITKTWVCSLFIRYHPHKCLLNIIYSYPALPLRVANSSNELKMCLHQPPSWCGAPHTSTVSSLQTNLNVCVEKCILHEVPGLFETVINFKRRRICWSLCEAVNEISILFQHQMFLQVHLRHWNSVFIQFVPFRDYIDRSGNQVLSMARLAKDVLAEIPEQLLSFMKSRGIEPRSLVPATSNSASVST